MNCRRTSRSSGQPGKVYVEFVESISPVANGLDSTHFVMWLAFHLTAEVPILTGDGNSPFLINR